MQFYRAHCVPLPERLVPGDCLIRSNRAAHHLECTDRYIRYLVETGQLRAYFDPNRPKILFFLLSEVLEYKRHISLKV